MKEISLSHGNGGQENNELINSIFFKHFKNDILEKSEDAAIINNGKLAFTTDSFTVSPLFFPGGDIGKLSICGTCNDLAMMGAQPKYLTCAVILEEGFSLSELDKIVISMQKELKKNNAVIVCGDTKVVPKGAVDKIFINTSGIGEIKQNNISSNNVKEDEVIILSSSIGEHGACIFAQREGIDLDSSLKSDCRSLWPIINEFISNDIKISALRDATRGGVSAVLNEWAVQNNVCIEINEKDIKIKEEVKGICELLGFEALDLANEGTFVMSLPLEQAQKALKILKAHKDFKDASIIGKVSLKEEKKVILHSAWNTSRYLESPCGELLPRIC